MKPYRTIVDFAFFWWTLASPSLNVKSLSIGGSATPGNTIIGQSNARIIPSSLVIKRKDACVPVNGCASVILTNAKGQISSGNINRFLASFKLRSVLTFIQARFHFWAGDPKVFTTHQFIPMLEIYPLTPSPRNSIIVIDKPIRVEEIVSVRNDSTLSLDTSRVH